jgi:hypothetical protein
VSLVKGDGSGDVDVGNAIAVGHAERFVAFDELCNFLKPSAGSGLIACVDQRDAPGFGHGVVHRHLVFGHVKGDIRGVQKVVGEVLLDDVALVAAADDEVVDPVSGVELEDVP